MEIEPVVVIPLVVLAGSLIGYFHARGHFLSADEMAEIRARSQAQTQRFFLGLEQRRQRWADEQRRLAQFFANIDGEPVVMPDRDPIGEAPPIYLYAALEAEDFAAALTLGLQRPEVIWSEQPSPGEAQMVVTRILANEAFMAGAEARRGARGWSISHLLPRHIDREWILRHRRTRMDYPNFGNHL